MPRNWMDICLGDSAQASPFPLGYLLVDVRQLIEAEIEHEILNNEISHRSNLV